MARAKRALASLPWVDQTSVQANVETQEVRFRVTDAKQYDTEQLQAAFAKVRFTDTKVLHSPAAR